MTDADARTDAMTKKRQKLIGELSENPELAKGTVGTIVFEAIRAGEEVSTTSIISRLKDIAAGAETGASVNRVLAAGALKVISDLQGGSAG
ncbi:MAG: hypothetical protein IE922_09635 [Sphingomonadales bacterium]|nr:hypothetical protein [Sphingomonadales bacterium]